MSGGPGSARAPDWLFDLGNTRLKYAPLLAAGTVGEVVARTHRGEPAALAGAGLPRGRVAHVASVAGTATGFLLDALAGRFERVQVARTVPRWDGLRIAYAEPARLGVDRFLSMVAARRRVPGRACLLVAVGTALTLDLVDAGGAHLGGRIAPSPALMREALQARAPQLPAIGGSYAEFAADTADALASGCEGAALSLVERSLAQVAQRLGQAPALLLHGGGAGFLRERLPVAMETPALVLEGLACWAGIGRPGGRP